MKTIYGSPTVTAGNAPGLDAGAAALIVMRKSKAQAMGIPPLATIVSVASGASQPRRMAELPGFVIRKALERAALNIDDMKVIEINEAFAAVTLVSTKILAEAMKRSGGNCWARQTPTAAPSPSAIPWARAAPAS